MFGTLRRKLSPPAVEQRRIDLSGRPVTYTLKRSSKRRSIGLRIDERGLTVSVPLRASEKWLHSVLRDKAGWVVEKMAGWQARQAPVIQWRDGEPVPFCGNMLKLRVVPDLYGAPPILCGENLHLCLAQPASPQRIEQAVGQWYRQQALDLFGQRVAHFAPQLQVVPRAVKLSAARSQWGSCTVRGVVRLNWRLIKLAPALTDYVVVHELAHLLEMNHSAAFWQVVGSVCPDYRQLRVRLREFGIVD